MSVEIEIDNASFDRLQKQMDKLRDFGGKSAIQSLAISAFAIRNEAILRLKGRGHIKTSRLANSLYIKVGENAKDVKLPDNELTYQDDNGATYNRDLKTVQLSADQIAVGSNVEYAAAIELGSKAHKIPNAFGKGMTVQHPGYKGDTYLYWAFKNVNVEQITGEKMKADFERFKT